MKVTQIGTGADGDAYDRLHVHGSRVRLAPDGWVLDLAEAGERVNVEMKLVARRARRSRATFRSRCLAASAATAGSTRSTSATRRCRFQARSSEFLADSLNVGFTVLQLAPALGSDNPTYTGVFGRATASTSTRP